MLTEKSLKIIAETARLFRTTPEENLQSMYNAVRQNIGDRPQEELDQKINELLAQGGGAIPKAEKALAEVEALLVLGFNKDDIGALLRLSQTYKISMGSYLCRLVAVAMILEDFVRAQAAGPGENNN